MIENACGSDSYIDEYNMHNEKIATMNKGLSLKYEKRKSCLEMMKEIKEVKVKEETFESLINQKVKLQKKIYTNDIRNKLLEIERVKETLFSLEKMKEDTKYNEMVYWI